MNNSTEFLNFSQICEELGAAIGLIPLIAILEQVAIAKAFGNYYSVIKKTLISIANFFQLAHGKRTDATQEMIALGVGNILGSFLGLYKRLKLKMHF